MRAIYLIAKHTLLDLFLRRFGYILLVTLGLLIGGIVVLSPQLTGGHGAFRKSVITEILKIIPNVLFFFWYKITYLYSIILSSTALSSEIGNKSIILILSRPVTRSQFIIGKWLGLILFIAGLMGIGTLAGILFRVATLGYMQLSLMVVLGMLQSLVGACLLASACFVLSAFLSPLGSIATLLLLAVISWMAPQKLLLSSSYFDQILGGIAYYCYPAKLRQDLLMLSLSSTKLNISYWTYSAVLLENVLYILALLFICVLIFQRREITET